VILTKLLVERPRETINIELKSWIDPKSLEVRPPECNSQFSEEITPLVYVEVFNT
jgi:hypothetical protein